MNDLAASCEVSFAGILGSLRTQSHGHKGYRFFGLPKGVFFRTADRSSFQSGSISSSFSSSDSSSS